MKKHILKKIREIVGLDNLVVNAEELSCYSFDATGKMSMPEAVVFPQTVEQISAIMLLANEFCFPVVPRGAGTGMSGGAIPVEGGVVLATSKMNRILEIDADNMICVVEPGVITGDLQKELRKYSLFYPPDPASLKFCTLGGNVSECAGGPSAVKYGVTRDYVIGLELVLPTGEIITTGVRTEKSVVGYDLTRLFIGSEGTLGIFTKLILRLLPLPESKVTFLLILDSLVKSTRLVADILATGLLPCTLEYMDKTAIKVVDAFIGQDLPAETEALLLVEFDGTRKQTREQTDRFFNFLKKEGVNFRQASEEGEAEKLWLARRSISPASFSLRPQKISEDVVVPRTRIPDLVLFTEQLASSLNLVILTFGHAGDGNIHVNIMIDPKNEKELESGQEAREKLFQYVLELGGSLSGEHGIGITKSRFLPLELSEETISVMKRIKSFFDPANVLNPGKIFPLQSGDQP